MRILIGTIILIAVVVFNFSATEARYECKGEYFQKDYGTTSIFIKLEQYRWWVGLWSDSDGNLKTEIPSRDIGYYGHIKEVGDLIQIYSTPGEMAGHLSMLSKSLSLMTSLGLFEGQCERLS